MLVPRADYAISSRLLHPTYLNTCNHGLQERSVSLASLSHMDDLGSVCELRFVFLQLQDNASVHSILKRKRWALWVILSLWHCVTLLLSMQLHICEAKPPNPQKERNTSHILSRQSSFYITLRHDNTTNRLHRRNMSVEIQIMSPMPNPCFTKKPLPVFTAINKKREWPPESTSPRSVGIRFPGKRTH